MKVGRSRANQTTSATSSSVRAARKSGQDIFESFQSAELPPRPFLLADPEPLGDFDAAELFDVSQDKHLAVQRI